MSQVQIPAPSGERAAARPRWERATQAAGAGFVALVVFGLIGLLGWGVLFKGTADGGPTRLDRPAPDFTLSLFDGGTFKLSENLGRPVVINFWASWCEACREEAPVLEQAWRDYREQGVLFIGVDIQDTRADALKFIEEFGITYPNGPDESDVYFDYGGTGVPESYFIDREGKIVIKFIGGMKKEQVEAFVGEILE